MLYRVRQLRRAFILQTPGIYQWSLVTERIGAVAAALVYAALLWSIVLNLSLALAPVREDASGRALVAWLMIGGPTMILNYLSLPLKLAWLGKAGARNASYIVRIGGLIAFFFTHGRQLVASSPYSESTISCPGHVWRCLGWVGTVMAARNTVDTSLFALLLPLFIVGVVLGTAAKLLSECYAGPLQTAEPKSISEAPRKDAADC